MNAELNDQSKKRGRSLASRRFSRGLLILAGAMLAITAPKASAQTVEPPGTVFKAGVVYGPSVSNIGTGNSAGGNLGLGGAGVLNVAATNSSAGLGGQLFFFQSNGDGSFSLAPPAGYNFGAAIQDGLNLIVAGPVVSTSSVDLVVTDDLTNLYLMKGNGDGTFQIPAPLGQTASTLASYLNSSGTLNLVISYPTFSGNVETSVVKVLSNNNDGSGSFTAQTLPTPKTPNVTNAYPLNTGGLTAILLANSDGTASISQNVAGTFQAPVSQGEMGTPNGVGLGPSCTFVSLGVTYVAGITTFSGLPAAYIWPVLIFDGAIVVGTPSIEQIPSNDAVFVTAADVDGDGNPDLIVLGGGQFSKTQTVNLFLSNPGNSLRGFSPELSMVAPDYIYGPGVYGTQAIVADANGDGKNDLILYEPNQGLTVLLNQGGGLFLAPATYTAGNKPVGIAKADFNGDGFDDLAVANGINPPTDTSDNTVSVFVSTGAGTYAPQETFATGTDPIAVATGVVGGNQSIFAVSFGDTSGNLTNPQVTFVQGNGNGTFQSPAYFSSGTNTSLGEPSTIATGVFDASGNSTVAVANSYGTINLFTYQNGVFLPSLKTPTLSANGAPLFGLSISSIAVADVDGDGNLDLVATLRATCAYNSQFIPTLSSGAVLIFPGNGDGTFKPFVSVTGTKATFDPASVALGSFVGGLLPDMLVVDDAGMGSGTCSGTSGVRPIVFSHSSGFVFFENDLPNPLALGTTVSVPLKAAIADVNGDGVNDVVLSENGLLGVFTSYGNTFFGPPTLYVGSSDSAGLVAGSFFGPGGHDVAMASQVGGLVVQSIQFLSGAQPYANFSPVQIDFGSVSTGSNATQVLTLTNTGDGVLDVPIFTLESTSGGPPPAGFTSQQVQCGAIVNPPLIAVVDPGNSCTVTLNFAPTAPGTQNAQIVFGDNALFSDVPTILAPPGGFPAYGQAIPLTGGTPATPTNLLITPNPASPAAFGTVVTLTAQVLLIPSGNVGSTGTVTFFDGTSSLGTFSLTGGVASVNLSSLTAGLHTFSFQYVDASGTYDDNTSSSLPFIILPTVSAVGVSPTSVNGGSSATGTVTLNGTVLSGDPVVVSLSSNSSAVQVPASITISSGNSGTFTISTSAVTASTTATITASSGSGSVSVQLTVVPAVTSQPVTLMINEKVTTTDSLGPDSTLISGTVLQINETVTTTDTTPAPGATVVLVERGGPPD